jgi:hypothetical protein
MRKCGEFDIHLQDLIHQSAQGVYKKALRFARAQP